MNRHVSRQINRLRLRQTLRQIKSRQISRHTDKQNHRQRDTQTLRHTDTQTELQFITFGMARTSSEGALIKAESSFALCAVKL